MHSSSLATRWLVLLLAALPLLTRAQTGSVGIGTTAPDPNAALDITSADKGLLIPRLTPTARRAIVAPPQGMLVFQTGAATVPTDSVGIWYATGQGQRWLYLPDARQSQVAATNGLTKTGNTLALGGPLTQPATTVDAGTNALDLTSADQPAEALDQQNSTSSSASALDVQRWQSFTAGASGTLTRLTLRLNISQPGGLTLSLYAGQGTGPAVLHTQPLTTTSAGSGQTISLVLTTPLLLTAGATYTIGLVQASGTHSWRRALVNPYAGGQAGTSPTDDYVFATYVTPPTTTAGLRLRGAAVQLTGLSGPALLNVAPDGTVGTQSAASVGDDLGDHTATQNLDLADKLLVGNGGTTGLSISGGGAVGIGTTAPNSKAALDISGTGKGLLIPRMDSATRAAIAAPLPDGLLVFQTDGRRGFWYAVGGQWVFIPDQTRAQVQATNGLTKTAPGTVALGGFLTQPTTVDASANALTLTSAAPPATLDQGQLTSTTSGSLTVVRWQSFTVGRPGQLRRVAFGLNVTTPGTLTFSLYQGQGTGGALLLTQPLTTTATGNAQLVSLTLTAPPTLVAGQVYTLALLKVSGVHSWQSANANPYAGGQSEAGANNDRRFATYMQSAVAGLHLAGGTVQLTGLSGPALLNVAADGTVGTQVVSTVGDDLGNHTATQNLDLADKLLVGNGGGTGLSISSDGAVGIGTGAPARKLDVAGDAASPSGSIQGLLRLTRPDNSGVKYASTAEWRLGSYSTSNRADSRLDLALGNGLTNDPDVTVLSALANGRVGIGTTAPAQLLDVAGNARTTGTVLARALVVSAYTSVLGPDTQADNQMHQVECAGEAAVTGLSVYATSRLDGYLNIDCANLTGLLNLNDRAWVNGPGTGANNQVHDVRCPSGKIAAGWRIRATANYLDGDIGLHCVSPAGGYTVGASFRASQIWSCLTDDCDNRFLGGSCPPGTFLTGIRIYAVGQLESINDIFCAPLSAD